jgi:hypothetical protein
MNSKPERRRQEVKCDRCGHYLDCAGNKGFHFTCICHLDRRNHFTLMQSNEIVRFVQRRCCTLGCAYAMIPKVSSTHLKSILSAQCPNCIIGRSKGECNWLCCASTASHCLTAIIRLCKHSPKLLPLEQSLSLDYALLGMRAVFPAMCTHSHECSCNSKRPPPPSAAAAAPPPKRSRLLLQ